ncbi:energy-coupled thiamine transporter ThiT [Lysinibacillus pakistanensis]|uniref:Energy-coupled thiamine transporter ThiT n=1 Tax=Lysinibacillus pakistanensis TaxID=759811 RepID=A0AAX3WUV1_9BACI|nr:energy-coupled thiamine transporter ThiT [Lysinibacillus pakistanensis]MDM5230435.1 energy-coupled thiamine transporter ThiT [Lysinibacillus pakistanensis]QGG53196.1 energy-coupled thiamine transporter ThiT [Lysinibacillus pakistanensis]WHY46018.1 energy-coupled thiamine transporter ThiT [Lysinibacillus pakistanensis]WHY51029.1 energy-coupled thiamine transporter ThiT [Lysinibacillus pakistanensis]
MDKKRLLMLVEIAIFAAIGLVLDQISFKVWAQGGSVSLVMVPIILIAFRWGLLPGLTTGFLIGVMQTMFGPTIVHWLQGLLDYGVAFTVVGLVAIVRRPVLEAANNLNKTKMALYIIVGTVLAGFLRYAAHTVAGAVFFSEYAGDQNAWIYSIIYNGTYMLPATVLTAIVGVLLFTAAPQLMQRKS